MSSNKKPSAFPSCPKLCACVDENSQTAEATVVLAKALYLLVVSASATNLGEDWQIRVESSAIAGASEGEQHTRTRCESSDR